VVERRNQDLFRPDPHAVDHGQHPRHHREVGHGRGQEFEFQIQFPARIAGEHQGFLQGRHLQALASLLFRVG
jgi:hypothetical protein